MTFQDEGSGLYWGAIDRYDWKIVGKKEMFIPYNCYDSYLAKDEELFDVNHQNMDKARWELHRVWVVEATVAEGKRHQYARRLFYIDEDAWHVVLHDAYDAQGSLWRTSVCDTLSAYQMPTTLYINQLYYDLQTTTWGINHTNDYNVGIRDVPEHPLHDSFWDVETLRKLGRR
jgi:hypothetical protein